MMGTRRHNTLAGLLAALTAGAAEAGKIEVEPDGVRSCRLTPEQVQRVALAMHAEKLGRHFTGRDGTGRGWVEYAGLRFCIGPLTDSGSATLSWAEGGCPGG